VEDGVRQAPDRYVTVYCKAQSHAGNPWIIGTWIRAGLPDGGEFWLLSSDQFLAGMFIRKANRDREDPARTGVRERDGVRLLDDDKPEDRRELDQADRRGESVFTNRLRCHLCVDAVKRSASNLQRDLDLVAATGERDVTLDHLRRVGSVRF